VFIVAASALSDPPNSEPLDFIHAGALQGVAITRRAGLIRIA